MTPHARPAVLDDAQAIAQLLGALGYPSLPDQVRVRLQAVADRPDMASWVGLVGGRVVGLVGGGVAPYFERDGTYGCLLVLVVADDARGSGIGRLLVSRFEAWAIARGARSFVVNSGNHRAEAHRFYERLGYAATGIRFVKELGS